MRIPFLLFALLLLSFGCSDVDPTTQHESDLGAQKNYGQSDVEAKGKPVRKAYTEEELNRPYSTVSPWRYIVTGPETQYFERLVARSELARTIHGSGHAVLVPRDQTFTQKKDWKSLMDDRQSAALDRFIRAHILVGVRGTKSLEGDYEDLNGNSISISRNEKGELMCGGARLLDQEVETDQGLVIPVVGMVEEIRWN